MSDGTIYPQWDDGRIEFEPPHRVPSKRPPVNPEPNPPRKSEDDAPPAGQVRIERVP